MISLNDLPERLQVDDPEERHTISPVSWSQYETLLSEIGDQSSYHISYLNGVLEIVAPSRRHESGKTRIGTLLEIYFLETNIEYFPTGSTTFRKPEQEVGVEPDESYCIGTDKEFPDLVIEVLVTSGGINRLAIYQQLGIQEVWFWSEDRLAIYHLRQNLDQFTANFGYEAINRSQVLPELNIELLTESIQNPSPLAAAKAFREGIL
ncbi:MAG: Uma2 family endonuclease [Trichodesmium sp. St15_bin1_1]|nr:Uma2 family endonuclease [Trichodesmium sp. St5_bin2_1]MDE5083020.1 Uma2 family endonuclease [Trichodesmium sp. St18_bin1]MDE5086594.1 Uma2 family endonuclease [Trichodesmium sp. St16_bin2-tuft]MDE5113105.1 Uma2 family endonuclease [Trichodesmium sp. St15_bin1_1]MDE5120350.1 Uma2 family endonuclease [Trichodesmium sp. St19_bin1]